MHPADLSKQALGLLAFIVGADEGATLPQLTDAVEPTERDTVTDHLQVLLDRRLVERVLRPDGYLYAATRAGAHAAMAWVHPRAHGQESAG